MRRSNLSKLSISALQTELRRRGRGLRKLQQKRDSLVRRVHVIEAEIRGLGGEAMLAGGRAGGVRRRPKNEMNLVEALGKVLNGKTMSVTEVAEAVQQAGYKTSSSTFRTIVNQTLINSGKFKRIARGQYTAK
jgi:hypothetical protein